MIILPVCAWTQINEYARSAYQDFCGIENYWKYLGKLPGFGYTYMCVWILLSTCFNSVVAAILCLALLIFWSGKRPSKYGLVDWIGICLWINLHFYYSDFNIKVVQVSDSSHKSLKGHEAPVLTVALDPNEEFLVTKSLSYVLAKKVFLSFFQTNNYWLLIYLHSQGIIKLWWHS